MQRVGVLTELPRLLRKAGIEPGPVLAAAGVHPHMLDDIESLLTYEQFSQLTVETVRATQNDDFFLLMGATARPDHLGILGRYIATGPNLSSALTDLVTNHPRYVRGGGPYLLARRNGDLLIGYRTHLPGIRGATHIARGALSFGCSVFRQLTGVEPAAILVSVPPPPDVTPYRRIFGRGPISFNAEHFGLVYSKASLSTPISTADPELRRQLHETITMRWAMRQPDLRERVMRTLVPSIFSGSQLLSVTAERVGMSPSALHRALKRHGCTFRDLLNQARFEMASQFLIDARMSIGQIAEVLGYSEVSAFNRFFTAMSGMPPARWRLAQRLDEDVEAEVH
jgi:AraC-like DNA-binding protein